MLNQIIFVGRLTKEIEIIEENGEKVGIISLAVPRSYKNMDGIYETDFLDFVARGNIGKNVAEYCKKGDIVGIKGRAESTKEHVIVLVAEKVTFLSSKKSEDREEESEEV